MMQNFSNFGGPMLGGSFGLVFLLMMVWAVFWKGLALWHSAGRKQGWWFVIFLVVNTAGILEIVYLFGILKLKADEAFVFLKK